MKLPWYFITDIIILLITIGVIGWAWPRLISRERIAACITAGIVMPLQVINEYLSLFTYKAWSFSDSYNRLIGIVIFGIPIEEFLFWFAFAWFIPFAYAGLVAYFQRRVTS